MNPLVNATLIAVQCLGYVGLVVGLVGLVRAGGVR